MQVCGPVLSELLLRQTAGYTFKKQLNQAITATNEAGHDKDDFNLIAGYFDLRTLLKIWLLMDVL